MFFFFQSIMLSMDGWCFVTLLRPWYQYINMRNTDFHTIDVTINTCNGHVTPTLGFLKDVFFQQMRGRPPSAILGCNCRPILAHEHCPLYFHRSPLSCILVFFLLCLMLTPKNNHRSRTPHVVGGLGFFILVQVDVSENSGTPKSSILIGFSIIFTIHFEVPLFL